MLGWVLGVRSLPYLHSTAYCVKYFWYEDVMWYFLYCCVVPPVLHNSELKRCACRRRAFCCLRCRSSLVRLPSPPFVAFCVAVRRLLRRRSLPSASPFVAFCVAIRCLLPRRSLPVIVFVVVHRPSLSSFLVVVCRLSPSLSVVATRRCVCVLRCGAIAVGMQSSLLQFPNLGGNGGWCFANGQPTKQMSNTKRRKFRASSPGRLATAMLGDQDG